MSFVATAIVGSAVVSGYFGSQAADAQADASRDAARMSTAEQRRQFDLQRSDSAPYRAAGVNALNSLNRRSLRAGDYIPPEFTYEGNRPDFTGESTFDFNLEEDPGYQFARDQGIKYANREAAAGGRFNSGNRLAEIADRVTGIASQYADQSFNRQITQSRENYGRASDIYGRQSDRENQDYSRALTGYGLGYQRQQDMYGQHQNYLNRQSAIANVGQTANQASAAAGSNMANAIGNINMANAAAQANAANTRYGAYNNAIQGGISNYMLYNNTRPADPDAWMYNV